MHGHNFVYRKSLKLMLTEKETKNTNNIEIVGHPILTSISLVFLLVFSQRTAENLQKALEETEGLADVGLSLQVAPRRQRTSP